MDGATSYQQDSWQSNIYLISTTRILMALGLTFLIRSAYQLYQRMRSAGSEAGVRGVGANTEIDLEAFPLGGLGNAAAPTPGPIDGINETLAVTFPPPTHHPVARSLSRTIS